MFRNVTLKCLTEIAGVSVNQYEEQFVNLFTLTMCQLKQVHTDTLNHTQLHFYTSANPQITSVCPHKGWICAFLLHRCCLWTLILDWPIPMGRTMSKILSRTSACSSAPSLKSTASSSRRDPTCERRWWRWDTPTLVDHEQVSTPCPKFIIYHVGVCRWHNFSWVSVAACQVIYISPMFKIYFWLLVNV